MDKAARTSCQTTDSDLLVGVIVDPSLPYDREIGRGRDRSPFDARSSAAIAARRLPRCGAMPVPSTFRPPDKPDVAPIAMALETVCLHRPC
jgi:hypothetical protein